MPGPSDKIKVVDSPTALPGKCACCGGADKESFVDYGLDFEYYGAFYLCEECVYQTANLYGWSKPEDVIAMTEKMSEAVAENLVLKKKLSAAEAYIRESFTIDPGGSGSGPTAVEHVLSVVLSESDEVDEDGVSDKGNEDSESTESSDEQGPDDLRDSSSTSSTTELTL